MRDRIDPLIAERAPWLYNTPGIKPVRGLMHLGLGYDKTVAIGNRLKDRDSRYLMRFLGKMLAKHVTATGFNNLPAQGPALIVANHPTGIGDGIILHHLIARKRSDAYIFTNADVLRVMPQMSDIICPVEWRLDKRTHAKTRETMGFVRKATDEGRLGVIFPSGRLAKRRGLSLHERPWMASAAMLAKKFDLPVIPVHISARNSSLFYLFDKLHPTLRDVTLFHETLNKDRQPFVVRMGEPISAAALPRSSEEGIAMLRRATLALGETDQHPGVSIVKATRIPSLKW